MKKYTTPAEIIGALDTIAAKKIKHYFTDWTDYDRPKAARLMKENPRRPFYFVPRDTGSWLWSYDEIATCESALYTMEANSENADSTFYHVDPARGRISRMKPGQIAETIRDARGDLTRRKAEQEATT